MSYERRTLSLQEKIDWLRLSRTERVGPVTFRDLLRRFGTAAAAMAALPDLARRGGRTGSLRTLSQGAAEKELAQMAKMGIQAVALCEPDYPEPLAQIDDAPPLIFCKGQLSLLHKPCIGIVGARNASLNGRKMTEKLAADLGQAGYVIASGLARGIDGAAHTKALATGTIAVLAGGVDCVYPEENRALYEQMAEIGCLLSEQPLGLEPMANLFPRRNRLISGLSCGVVVVEAALKSGSLITARMALEQGREVFAVPGSPLDPRAQGPNDLIRQGALLTESARDVLDHLSMPVGLLKEPPVDPFGGPSLSVSEAEIEANRLKIIENLSTSPVPVDEMVRRCQFSLPLVLTVLLELELAGRLERHPGNQVSLIG